MVKNILPVLQVLLIALQNQNLFVDAKGENTLRGSQVENQLLVGFLRELPEASTNQNKRLLKNGTHKQSDESTIEKADKKDSHHQVGENENGPSNRKDKNARQDVREEQEQKPPNKNARQDVQEEQEKKPPNKNARQDVLEGQKKKPPNNANNKDDDLDKDGKDEISPVSPPTETLIAPTLSPVSPPTENPIAPTLTPVSPPTETPIAPTFSPKSPPTDTPIAPTLSPISPPTETPIAPTFSPVSPPTETPIAPTLSPVSPPTETPIAQTLSPVSPPTETPIAPTLSPVSPPTEIPKAPTLSPVSPPIGSRIEPTLSPIPPPTSKAPTLSPISPPIETPIAQTLPTASNPTKTPISQTLSPVSPLMEITMGPSISPVSPPTETPIPPQSSPTDTPVSPTFSPVSSPIETLILPTMSPESHPTIRPAISFTSAPSFEGSSTLIYIPSVGQDSELVVPMPSSNSASASTKAPFADTRAPSLSTNTTSDMENNVPPTKSQFEEVIDEHTSNSSDNTGEPESDQAPEFQFDKNKYVDGEKLQTITFSMTVSEFTKILNVEKLEAYFKDFVEDVLEMRSNRDWYPFHSKSVHNITMELLPNFFVERDIKERNANFIVPVQLNINGIVLVNFNEQDRQQRNNIIISAPSAFKDSFDHSMLLYFTFWGVDTLQNVLEEVGGLRDLVIRTVSVGKKELIAIDKDGTHLIKSDQSSSNQIVAAVSDIEKKSSASASKCGLLTHIMFSASLMWYF